jgi:hypothetical protein
MEWRKPRKNDGNSAKPCGEKAAAAKKRQGSVKEAAKRQQRKRKHA